MTCTVHHVVGARPNFMKLAPVLRALDAREGFENVLVHTGQHYDHALSGSFFESLGIREPDERLGVGSGSHAVHTAGVMTAFDALLDSRPADLVVVVGDVNSTVAAALVAAKRHIPVAHVERARASDALEREGVQAGEYALVTLHRPSNVDDRDVLEGWWAGRG